MLTLEEQEKFLSIAIYAGAFCVHKFMNKILFIWISSYQNWQRRMIMRYQILMDSCGDGEEEQYQSGQLKKITLGIVNEEENGIPKTSCPAPSDFMEQVADEVQHIYMITLSSRLSGTYNSARTAVNLIVEEKESLENRKEQKYCVIDSKSASAGETLLAWMIQEMRK